MKLSRSALLSLALLGALLAARPATSGEPLDGEAADALDAGRFHEAVALCDSALALHPNDASLLALRGRAELALGRIGPARADLRKVARRSRRSKREVAEPLARAELLYGNEGAVEDLVPLVELGTGAILEELVHGPFEGRLGDVAAVASGRSPGGHYLVFSDVGLDDETVAALGSSLVAGARVEPAKGVREVGRLLEASRSACLGLLPMLEDEKVVLRVYVFGRQADFEEFGEVVDGEKPRDDDGDFYPETRVVAVDADPGADPRNAMLEEGATIAESARDTIFHESFHQLVSFYAPQIPSWLDEGMAEWFGATEVLDSGEIRVGVVKKSNDDYETRYETVTQALENGTALPLADFLTLSEEAFYVEEDLDRNYGQAWSVAHFLMAKHRKLLLRYLGLLHEGKEPEEAFDGTFAKKDLKKLDQEWRSYVKGL